MKGQTMRRVRKKNFRERKMADEAAYFEEMRNAVIFAGGQKGPFEPRPDWLVRAAIALGIEPSRAARYFYRKAKNVPAWEADQIRARVAALQQRLEAIHARNIETRETIARARASFASRASDPHQRPNGNLGNVARGDGQGDGE